MKKAYLFFWQSKQEIVIAGTHPTNVTNGYTLVHAEDSAEAFKIMDKAFNPTTIQYDIKLATIIDADNQVK